MPGAVSQSFSLQQLNNSEHTIGLVLSEGDYKIGGINKRYAGKKAGNKTKGSRKGHLAVCLSGESKESISRLGQPEANDFETVKVNGQS